MEYRNNKIKGWMGTRDLHWLFEIAKEMENIVEIGSWKGRSTHALLSGCSGVVYAVDHFLGSKDENDSTHKEGKESDIYSQFLDNVGSFDNLKILRMSSLDAVKQFEDKSVDMVFIDGGHSYEEVVQDIKAWLPKCKKLLCGHDIPYDSVSKAVKDTIGDVEINIKRGTIWVKHINAV